MATQGAVQIQVTINNQSITISKDHLVSLHIERVVGDSANNFTLEAFDETAWQLENALMGKEFAPITVSYSAANNLTKAIMFSGTCYNYQMSFVGNATMLSIEGVLSASAGEIDGWWFDKRSIEWCGCEPENRGTVDNPDWWVDGKSEADTRGYKNNEDVCAILDFSKVEEGKATVPTVYFNPTRIFKRIIHKYDGDKLGSTTSSTVTTTTTSSGVKADSNNVTDTVWRYFKEKGFSNAATAGIMGNIQQESGFDPKRLQNGKGPAAGLFQWENYITQKARWASLNNYAKKRGTEWTDLITQLDFAYSEMPGCFSTYSPGNWGTKVTLDEFKTWTNVDNCTEIFEKVFERAGTPRMENRKKYAKGFLELYANVRTTTTTTTTTTAGAVEGWGEGGTGKFKIAKAEPSRWVSGFRPVQENCTAAEFITNVLCKNAVTDTGKYYKDETAGFQYWVDAKGHHFEPLDYMTNRTTKLSIQYGMKNSRVISFSIAKIGTLAMLGVSTDSDGNTLMDTSALDYITGDQITSGGENILDSNMKSEYDEDSEEIKKKEQNINWYFANVQAVKITSSSTQNGLNTKLTNTWSDLKGFSYSAELTLWGDVSKGHQPGDYLDLTVTGAGGVQHYASGIYMILKIDDNISADGYTQTMKLFKIQKEIAKTVSRPEYVEAEVIGSDGEVISGDAPGNSTSTSTSSSVISYTPPQGPALPSKTENTNNTPTYNRPVTKPDYSKFNITLVQ